MKKFAILTAILLSFTMIISCSDDKKDENQTQLMESVPSVDTDLITKTDVTLVRRGCKYKW